MVQGELKIPENFGKTFNSVVDKLKLKTKVESMNAHFFLQSESKTNVRKGQNLITS